MSNFRYEDLPPWRKRLERASILLTLYSVVCLVLELEMGAGHHSTGFWLWNERAVAAVFTVEYFFRWYVSHDRRGHPFRWIAVIDLVSILPFYVGFFVGPEHLGIVRSLRILRVLRLYRHSDSLVMIGRAFARCRGELAAVATFAVVATVLCAMAMYNLEKDVQPDKVGRPSDAIWWAVVTMSTVGYGDIAPVTVAGRVVGVLTILLGVASYGVCVTLFGGAWIDVLRERREYAQRLSGG